MLVNLLRLIHFILIIYIISSPFNTIYHLKNSIALLVFVIFNWKIGSNCMLTKLEYILLGNKDMESGFIYRIINPHLQLECENDFDKLLELYAFYYLAFLIFIYAIRTCYV